jgi:hypothetical protein
MVLSFICLLAKIGVGDSHDLDFCDHRLIEGMLFLEKVRTSDLSQLACKAQQIEPTYLLRRREWQGP